MSELENKISEKEIVKWRGKPNKKVYVLKSIFNPLMPFSIIWAVIDIPMMITSVYSLGLVSLLFFLVHMLPVWIYIYGIVSASVSYKNVEYIITDKAIYFSGGFNFKYQREPINFLDMPVIKQTIIERKNNVASLYFFDTYDKINKQKNKVRFACICCISEYSEAFAIIQNSKISNSNVETHPNDYHPLDEELSTYQEELDADVVKTEEKEIKRLSKSFYDNNKSDSDYTNWDN